MLRTTFFDVLSLKSNNFGFLRFFLACAVLYDHLFILGGFGSEPISSRIAHQEDVGSLAVLGFFIISGYLVTASFINSKTILSYSLKRFLRIMPAFWICLIVTAFIFAPLLYFSEENTLHGFFSISNGPFQYIKHDFLLFMHQYLIGDLLKTNPYNLAFDGSLWTLILEVKSYILLGILGAFGLLTKRKFIFLFF